MFKPNYSNSLLILLNLKITNVVKINKVLESFKSVCRKLNYNQTHPNSSRREYKNDLDPVVSIQIKNRILKNKPHLEDNLESLINY